MTKTTTTRKSRLVRVVDNRPLAKEVGGRIRRLRKAAGLTQRELAEPRYTGAYVSALENGLAKPSMAALHYLAGRLGIPIKEFLPGDIARTSRLDADLRLASGDHDGALAAYQRLLENEISARERAEVLSSIAEAQCRLRRGRAAIGSAAESIALFERLHRDADVAYASYWLAYGHLLAENTGEARAILRQILNQVRQGLDVLPDFKFRLLVGLANVEAWAGNADPALAHLEEARSLVADLDEWRQATFLLNLSRTYRAVGDDEASFRAGTQALAMFQSQAAKREVASLENTLALTLVRLGHFARAHEFADLAHRHAEELPDSSFLANVLETEAQIALAEGELPTALERLSASDATAEASGNREVLAANHHTRARVLAAQGDAAGAVEEFAKAAAAYRELELTGRLRLLLSDWAELLSQQGKADQALDLYREALALRPAE